MDYYCLSSLGSFASPPLGVRGCVDGGVWGCRGGWGGGGCGVKHSKTHDEHIDCVIGENSDSLLHCSIWLPLRARDRERR